MSQSWHERKAQVQRRIERELKEAEFQRDMEATIEQRKAEIQAEWTDDERRRRMVGRRSDLTVAVARMGAGRWNGEAMG